MTVVKFPEHRIVDRRRTLPMRTSIFKFARPEPDEEQVPLHSDRNFKFFMFIIALILAWIEWRG